MNATELKLSNNVVRDIVRAAEDVLAAANECEQAEGRVLAACNFSGFKDVIECLHLTLCETEILNIEVRVSESSSPVWLRSIDPFLFNEILSDKSIGLILTD